LKPTKNNSKMHYSNLLLPLLTLSLSTPALGAHVARNPKRHHLEVEKSRRSETPLVVREAEVAQDIVKKSPKGKRLVKKKRGTCAVKGNSTVPVPSSGSSATSVIGNGAWAGGPSSSASSTASAGSAGSSSVGTASYANSTTNQWRASSTTSAPATSSSASATNYGGDWVLDEAWQGNSFFDHWDFWSYDDPTHGTVSYQDAGNSWNQGLISINSQGHAIMDVDKTQHVQGGRKSVRIHGKKV
jgi:hypothetical protein